MNAQHEPSFTTPFLKEEVQNNNRSENEEEKTADKRPEYRDPWADLLFGKRPAPSVSSEESQSKEEMKDDDA